MDAIGVIVTYNYQGSRRHKIFLGNDANEKIDRWINDLETSLLGYELDVVGRSVIVDYMVIA